MMAANCNIPYKRLGAPESLFVLAKKSKDPVNFSKEKIKFEISLYQLKNSKKMGNLLKAKIP